MRFVPRLALLKALLLTLVATALPQTPAAQSAENLRAQLLDVEAKASALQERARQLDEDLKPENIERALALNGSTKPEELREQRRRQLESEKEKVRVQLDQLAASRTRLEAAIATADAEAYRQSALPVTNPSSQPQANTGSTQASDSTQASEPAQKPRHRSRRTRRARRRRT